QALQLRVDGKLLPDGQGVLALAKPAKNASATWTVPVPPGKHDLAVLARCPDVSGASEPRAIDVPATAAQNDAALYLVAVAINYKNAPQLPDLGCPDRDAEAIEKAFRAACVGSNTLFSRHDTQLLQDTKATREGVLAALQAVRAKKPRPQDLVVF